MVKQGDYALILGFFFHFQGDYAFILGFFLRFHFFPSCLLCFIIILVYVFIK